MPHALWYCSTYHARGSRPSGAGSLVSSTSTSSEYWLIYSRLLWDIEIFWDLFFRKGKVSPVLTKNPRFWWNPSLMAMNSLIFFGLNSNIMQVTVIKLRKTVIIAFRCSNKDSYQCSVNKLTIICHFQGSLSLLIG